MSFRIVDFEDRHTEDVLKLLSDTFGYDYSRDYLNIGTSRKFVLLAEDKVVGFLEYEVLFDTAEIFMIAVHKEFQGRKLGKMLMEFCVENLKTEGVKYVYLDVATNNTKAIEFYKKHGFEVVYIRKNYYRNGTDAYVMKKDI